jgi:hypothetical protein
MEYSSGMITKDNKKDEEREVELVKDASQIFIRRK